MFQNVTSPRLTGSKPAWKWRSCWHTPRSKRNLSNMTERAQLSCAVRPSRHRRTLPRERCSTQVLDWWGQQWGCDGYWRRVARFLRQETKRTGMGLVVFYPTLERDVEACKFKWLGGLAETQHNALLFWCTLLLSSKCKSNLNLSVLSIVLIFES